MSQARSILRGAGVRAFAAARTAVAAPAGNAAAIRSRAFHMSRPTLGKGGILPLRCCWRVSILSFTIIYLTVANMTQSTLARVWRLTPRAK